MAISSFSSSAASGSNDFSLSVGTTTNTTYILERIYPAGRYKVAFNSDTSYDVYVVSNAGVLVGYTNGADLIVTDSFKQLSVLGAAASEVIKFSYLGTSPEPSSKGDISVAGAFISSVATSNLAATNASTVITGGNFAPGLQVFFTGIDAVSREAKSVTRTNSTTATAVRPDTFPANVSPFSVKVVNPGVVEPTGSSSHILTNAVTSGVAPTWTTGASLPGIYPNSATTITLVATDADGGAITYTLVSGTLPAGMTLNSSSGVISGTPTTEATYVFTIRATDRENFYVDREFTVISALPKGQQEFSSTGSFTVPTGVTSISAVAVGAGGLGVNGENSNYGHGTGGAGGSLRYVNAISVTPGESLTVTVGANNSATTIARGGTVLVSGAGGKPGAGPAQSGTGTATPNYYGSNVGTGGDGGNGGDNIGGFWGQGAGGGGAGGYTGNGGRGGSADMIAAAAGSGGAGGGGGLATSTQQQGKGGRGGGVGLLGAGTSGAGGATASPGPGNPGGNGSANTGGHYGGGGGGSSGYSGGYAVQAPQSGGARIIWGPNRSFPSTGTGNV